MKVRHFIGLKYNLILLFVITVQAGIAQQYEIKATIDTNLVLIGDQLNLVFEVKQPMDLFVNIPIFNDTIIENVEIIEKFNTDTIPLNEGNILLRQRYLISSFDSGFYVIPPLPFLLSKETVIDTFYSNPLFFVVQTMQVDTTNRIYDIKQPVEAPFTLAEIIQLLKENWYYILGGIILWTGIIFLIYAYIRRKNNKPLFGRAKPILPPHIVAYKGLDDLKQKKLWQRGKVKEYYTELTDIIRTYLEGRYNLNALEQTSEEILQSFKYIRFEDDSLFRNLKKLLELSDLVKFAKESPLPDENESHYTNSYLFIDKTKLVAEEGAEGEEENAKNEESSNEIKKELHG